MDFSVIGLNFLYAILGVVLMFLAYRVIDLLTPEVYFPAELRKGNIAVAIFIAAIFLSVAMVIAHSLNGRAPLPGRTARLPARTHEGVADRSAAPSGLLERRSASVDEDHLHLGDVPSGLDAVHVDTGRETRAVVRGAVPVDAVRAGGERTLRQRLHG